MKARDTSRLGSVLKPPSPDASRVVDENVEAAERVEGLLERRCTARRRRYISDDAINRRAAPAKFAKRRGDYVGSAAADGGFGTLGEEGVRKGETDAAGPAGDQNTFAANVHDCTPASLSCVLVSKSEAS
jgi:hypothetical protein